MSVIQRLYGWFEERYPLREVQSFLAQQAGKRLPPHTSWLHTLGSLLVFLVLSQIVTGILLMVYFRPSPEAAFESIIRIMTRTHFGWLIRGLHAWGANIMILLMVAHMFRTFVMGAFKKPRELTWITGVLLFGVVLSFGFTGYLLPWSQVSYWGTTVGTEIIAAIPGLGDHLKTLLRGGDAVSGETLARYYVVHVAVMPWILVGLTAIHVFFVRVHGIAPLEPVGRESKLGGTGTLRFFPDHVAKDSVVVSVFAIVLVAIVFLAPPELGEKADPYRSPDGVKPEWYFLPIYQLLKYFPKVLGLFVSVVPFVLLLLWPFLDRSRQRHPRGRPWSMIVGCGVLLVAVAFGFLGHLSERTVTLIGTEIRFDILGIPSRAPVDVTMTRPAEPEDAVALETALSVENEEGRKMVIASVSQGGKPREGVKVAFFVEVEAELSALGQDETLGDGTAAVPFPQGIPGGPEGELRFVAETKEPAGPRSRAAATFLGGIPVSACPWRPASIGTVVLVGGTLAAGVATACSAFLLARARRRAS